MTTKSYISLSRKTFLVMAIMALFHLTYADVVAKKLVVNLYGHLLQFDLNADFFKTRSKWTHDEAGISGVVNALWDNPNTDSLIHQLDRHADALSMDDMAYLMLLNKTTTQVLKNEDAESQTLFKYAVLSKKGFDVILGYGECGTTLYGRTNINIENCLYITQGNKTYFDLSFSQHHLPSAEQALKLHYPGIKKARPVVMNTITPPAFNALTRKKVIPFEYDGFVYFFNCQINQSLVEYYHDLPTIDIGTVYLNYGLSEGVKKSLSKELRTAVADMSTSEAVNFILKFTQTAFEYKKDELVYGEEKFSFPEETLVNAYADCEDKAMLFATLINETLGLKTVALFYKDARHINVAVQSWNKKQKGNFSFNDQPYIICEPSGNGLTAGENVIQMNYASLIDW